MTTLPIFPFAPPCHAPSLTWQAMFCAWYCQFLSRLHVTAPKDMTVSCMYDSPSTSSEACLSLYVYHVSTMCIIVTENSLNSNRNRKKHRNSQVKPTGGDDYADPPHRITAFQKFPPVVPRCYFRLRLGQTAKALEHLRMTNVFVFSGSVYRVVSGRQYRWIVNQSRARGHHYLIRIIAVRHGI